MNIHDNGIEMYHMNPMSSTLVHMSFFRASVLKDCFRSPFAATILAQWSPSWRTIWDALGLEGGNPCLEERMDEIRERLDQIGADLKSQTELQAESGQPGDCARECH